MTSPITQLIHNPGAGFSDHSKQSLKNILVRQNWDASYMSTKGDWDIDRKAEIVLIAGGDGTVRKVVAKIASWPHKPILGVLPMGTANNIANSLGIDRNIRKTLRQWQENQYKTISYDLGIVQQPIDGGFFLESIGAGLFPHLMKAMEHKKHAPAKNAKESLKNSLKTLHESGLMYEPHYAFVEIDKQSYSGLFLWIEVMNMKLMGPHLVIAPHAESNDNLLDIIMVKEEDRDKVIAYFESVLKNDPLPFPIPSIKAREIKLQWYGSRIHVDDDLLDFPSSGEMCIGIKNDELKFLTL